MKTRANTVSLLERRYGRAGAEALGRLHEAAADHGTVDADDVAAIADELGLPRAHLAGAASFFTDFHVPRAARHVRVCAGTACFATTRGEHLAELERTLGAPCGGAAGDGSVSLEPVYCLGCCYASPVALDGDDLRAGRDLAAQIAGNVPPRAPEIPFHSTVPEPIVLAGLTGAGPPAWSAWPEVVTRDRAALREEVLRSGLRGRGGAEFPVARKWEAAAGAPTDGPRYVVVNGDEGDPGSFADRLLMEHDPDRVLAGLAIAAHAVGATRGYVYVRSEYPGALAALRRALQAARAAGHLGQAVHGSDFDLDVEVVEGAGSYVAGEETALLHSLEGRRGGVAARPPYPTELGLYARPTVVNNVETVSALPWIVHNGGDAYARHGIEGDRGTKLVCLNERFARPGVYEVELGVPLRWICDELGGGLRDGARLRSLQVGGPLGGFLGPDDLDVPLSFAALARAGAALGHAGLVAFDDRVSGAEVLRHTWRFAASESCGTCVPCRVGTRRGLELAGRIGKGPVDADETETQEALLVALGASLCGFGQAVPGVIRSILRVYADELAPGGGP